MSVVKAQPSKLLAEWFWTDRWTGSSGFHLPMHARGFYREMLTQAWRRGGKLPSDPETICRIVGATEKEWLAAWPLISKFWRLDTNQQLVNDTQLDVYADAKAAVDRNHDRAITAANASVQARAQAKLKIELTQSPPYPSPYPSPISVSDSEEITQVSNNKQRDRPQPAHGNGNAVSLSAVNGHGKPKDLKRDPFTDEAVTERAGRFIERYQVIYPQNRKGARYAVKPARDYAAAVTLCETWRDDVRLEKLAVCFLTTDHKFAEEGSRTIPQFLALASWCDGKLAEWEAAR